VPSVETPLVELVWRTLLLLLAGYVTYRFDRRTRQEEKRDQRLASALDKAEENNRVLQGEESAVGHGIVEVVEMHDNELDSHDQRLRDAKDHRQDIERRLDNVKSAIAERHDDYDRED